jgi:ABC-type polysaccharide transport system permease subunit
VFANSVILAVYKLAACFPLPIILAISLNEVRSIRLRNTLQTITYAPYFISVVIVVGMMRQIFSPHYDIYVMIRHLFGLDPVDIPALLPTATILLILAAGRMMDISFAKVILLQSPINLRTSEALTTCVYEVGLLDGCFDPATAGGHGGEQLRAGTDREERRRGERQFLFVVPATVALGEHELVAVYDTHGDGGRIPVPLDLVLDPLRPSIPHLCMAACGG